MATYVFESMSASDAANFVSGDELIFLSASVANLGVTDNPAVTTPLTTTNESITLNDNAGHVLTFNAAELSGSSLAGDFTFVNGDQLLVGTSAVGEAIDASTYGVTAGQHVAAFGFGGADTIGGSVGTDTINGGEGNDVINGVSTTEGDYLLGGNGNDTINGGTGNDHIYGNLFSSVTGSVDGDDSIIAGAGKDYVNGNAGNDVISGGANDDRLYGGAGNDTIDGGIDQDYLQGNKGNDSLSGGLGFDELHGGADNDTLDGGGDNDALFGDNGNDLIIGGAGYDKLTGGAGNDIFKFAAGDAGNANIATAATAASHGVVDNIADFTNAQDTISLGFAVSSVLHTGTGVTFTDAAAAQTYAQQLIDADVAATPGNTHDVAAITVGADTYLFFNDTAGATINAAIKVLGVADTVFNIGTGSDFV